jgi:hypothetical protein
MSTFTRRSQSFDTDGNSTESVTTIEGEAIQISGKPATYARLGLSASQAPTLLFTPENYELRAWSNEFVLPGDEIEWAGSTFIARDVETLAPDGYVVLGWIVVERGGT